MPTNINFNKSLGYARTSRVVKQSIKFAPVNVTPPVITGNTTLGSVLTLASVGQWLNYPSSYAYQWQRGGVNITSATNSTYTLVQADSAAFITCVVTATNITGSASTASNQIKADSYSGTAPYVITAPTLSETFECANPANSVIIQNMVLGGTPTPVITYSWMQVNPLDPSFPPIEIGQYTRTLHLDYAYVETYLYCQITATNSAGVLDINTPQVYAFDCS